MKHLRKVLLFALALVLAVPAVAPLRAAALTSGDWEYILQNNTATVIKYNGSDNNIVVPSTLGGFPVVAIDGAANHLVCAFSMYEAPTYEGSSITVPEGVTRLGNRAFKETKVETINLPKSLRTVGEKAFYECTASSAALPDGVVSLGSACFWGCPNLKTAAIPAAVKTLPDGLFACSGVVSVTLKSGLTAIGAKDFYLCKSLESVSIPATVRTIGSEAFHGCEALKSLDLPYGVTEIPYAMCYGCSALKEFIVPTSVATIRDSAFWSCASLKELIVPTSVKKMYGCVAFCAAIERVTVPSTTEETAAIGNECPNLVVYTVKGSTADALAQKNKDSYVYDSSVDAAIHVRYNGARISFGPYGQSPVIRNGRTFVPLRSIFEAMGAQVTWDAKTSTVTAVRGGTTVRLTIGSRTIQVNNIAKTLDVAPFLLNRRTLVPVRAIAEAFGADVGWNQAGKIVNIAE